MQELKGKMIHQFMDLYNQIQLKIPYCSPCRYNSSNCLVSSCQSSISQGLHGTCNDNGTCDCTKTGGYSGSKKSGGCEIPPQCLNNTKTVYGKDNNTFLGCDCSKPNALSNYFDSKTLIYGNKCANKINDTTCSAPYQSLSNRYNWGTTKNDSSVLSLATKWHNNKPKAVCDASKGLINSSSITDISGFNCNLNIPQNSSCCYNVCENLPINRKTKDSYLIHATQDNSYYMFKNNDKEDSKAMNTERFFKIDIPKNSLNHSLTAKYIFITHLEPKLRAKFMKLMKIINMK